MLHREVHKSVAVLRMAHGKANALDVEFLRALIDALDAESRSGERALVLTGTGSIFCAGVDLVRFLGGGADYAAEFLPALDQFFEALIRCDKPVVGAVNGHAIAGGCIITNACDVRMMARGKAQIGVPELRVGVPFPQSAFEIMRQTVSPAYLREVLFEGKNYSAEAALIRGLIDEIVEPTDLLPMAIARAEELGNYALNTFALNKQMFWQPVLERFTLHGKEWQQKTNAAWNSKAVRDAVAAFVAGMLKK